MQRVGLSSQGITKSRPRGIQKGVLEFCICFCAIVKWGVGEPVGNGLIDRLFGKLRVLLTCPFVTLFVNNIPQTTGSVDTKVMIFT